MRSSIVRVRTSIPLAAFAGALAVACALAGCGGDTPSPVGPSSPPPADLAVDDAVAADDSSAAVGA